VVLIFFISCIIIWEREGILVKSKEPGNLGSVPSSDAGFLPGVGLHCFSIPKADTLLPGSEGNCEGYFTA